MYSSATVLVFAFDDGGVYGFTLDPQIQDFVLTHRDLTIPKRGNVYSCNEANSEGWDENWKAYIRNLKLGQGETKKPYALRYVGKAFAAGSREARLLRVVCHFNHNYLPSFF